VSLLTPLSGLFGLGVAARNGLYDRGILNEHRLSWPVVSIGNLRVGGAGKTPFVILLGELLQRRKQAFDVLSRGYGRHGTGVKLVDEKGSPRDFGDEPLLIARKLGVPVIVGADRYEAGRFAETMFAELRPAHGDHWMHLLDDGFQHRSLARDFDIVLVTADDKSDSLLPAGRLRENLTSLRRADAVVLEDGVSSQGLCVEGKHIWRISRKIQFPDDKAPSRPIAVCGVARPERFLNDLRAAGIEIAAKAIFRDHHAFSHSDIEGLLRLRDAHESEGFVTTEKDAINLAAASAGAMDSLQPMTIASLKLELHDEQVALDTMLATIAERVRARAGN
jgi:tetraacyldisaccharide 4'-kinase